MGENALEKIEKPNRLKSKEEIENFVKDIPFGRVTGSEYT